MKKIAILINILQSSFLNIFAQNLVLREKINQIIKSKNATVGVRIMNFEYGNTLIFNGNGHFPMQSVYKFHLGLAVLNQVDKGKLTLNQNIL